VRPETIVRVWAEYDHGTPAQLRWPMIVADEGEESDTYMTVAGLPLNQLLWVGPTGTHYA
jgi:hypothetical protein